MAAIGVLFLFPLFPRQGQIRTLIFGCEMQVASWASLKNWKLDALQAPGELHILAAESAFSKLFFSRSSCTP